MTAGRFGAWREPRPRGLALAVFLRRCGGVTGGHRSVHIRSLRLCTAAVWTFIFLNLNDPPLSSKQSSALNSKGWTGTNRSL